MDYPTLALVERFISVQGEGRNAGRAAAFIRFAGCNLDCVFADGSICDTPWRKANEKIRLDDLAVWVKENLPVSNRIAQYNRNDVPMVVLTGGEPTMAPAFDDTVSMFHALGYYVAVETNGTKFRETFSILNWITVSPKVDIHHANPLHRHARPGTLDPAVVRWKPHEYRYVITGRGDAIPPFDDNGFSQHYVSPALMADGSGLEAQRGIIPAFVEGAVDRCIEIVQQDPRWKISLQTHKWMLVR